MGPAHRQFVHMFLSLTLGGGRAFISRQVLLQREQVELEDGTTLECMGEISDEQVLTWWQQTIDTAAPLVPALSRVRKLLLTVVFITNSLSLSLLLSSGYNVVQ